jgi:Protein of unknown function (DUF2281)
MILEGNGMESIERQIAAGVRSLPPDRQHEVLTFVEFLQSKAQPGKPPFKNTISALEAAADLVGCLDGGPSDLSTNPQHMVGFGES